MHSVAHLGSLPFPLAAAVLLLLLALAVFTVPPLVGLLALRAPGLSAAGCLVDAVLRPATLGSGDTASLHTRVESSRTKVLRLN
jgi:hypothetical protein